MDESTAYTFNNRVAQNYYVNVNFSIYRVPIGTDFTLIFAFC